MRDLHRIDLFHVEQFNVVAVCVREYADNVLRGTRDTGGSPSWATVS